MTPRRTPNPYGGHVWVPALNIAEHGPTYAATLPRDFTCFRG